MGQKYKAVVFDLDGTLLDTSAGIFASVRYAVSKFHLRPLEEEELRTFVGPPLKDSFARVYGLKGAILQEVIDEFRNRYMDADMLKAEAYDGIYDVFKRLNESGITPAVATYKRHDCALMILKHFGFDQYTDIIYGADPDNQLKKKDIIRLALQDAGVRNVSEAVMVGDSDNDAIGAKDLGIDFIGVTYGFGFRTPEDVYQFPAVGAAKTTQELSKLLHVLCVDAGNA